jgi:DNA-binding transcriptional MerR regulator
MTDEYTETTGSLARKAGVLPETVRAYGDMALIDCRRLPNGVRMFRPTAVDQVRKILADRLARRGGNKGGSMAA